MFTNIASISENFASSAEYFRALAYLRSISTILPGSGSSSVLFRFVRLDAQAYELGADGGGGRRLLFPPRFGSCREVFRTKRS